MSFKCGCGAIFETVDGLNGHVQRMGHQNRKPQESHPKGNNEQPVAHPKGGWQ